MPKTQGAIELTYSNFSDKPCNLDVGKKKGYGARFSVSETRRSHLLCSPDIEPWSIKHTCMSRQARSVYLTWALPT